MRNLRGSSNFYVDSWLFYLALMLGAFGVLLVYSSSGVYSQDKFGVSGYFFNRQLIFALTGFVGMLLMAKINYQHYLKYGKWSLLIAVGLLLLVFIPGLGVKVNGARRWINLGGIFFQPVEMAKIFCLFYLVWSLSRREDRLKNFSSGILSVLLIGGSLSGIILLQPDFGNAVILFTLLLCMLFYAGARWLHIIAVASISVLGAVILAISSPYRLRRLMSFLDPWADPGNSGYQIIQSFGAFYGGGLFGKGLGNSQEKLYFLPEAHTDFIFAVLAEELGFIGVIVLISVFALLLYRGLQIALQCKDKRGALLAAGVVTLLGTQIVFNMLVVTGLLPTKGLPLPFISHGGSSMIASFFMVGLLMSVARYGGQVKRV